MPPRSLTVCPLCKQPSPSLRRIDGWSRRLMCSDCAKATRKLLDRIKSDQLVLFR